LKLIGLTEKRDSFLERNKHAVAGVVRCDDPLADRTIFKGELDEQLGSALAGGVLLGEAVDKIKVLVKLALEIRARLPGDLARLAIVPPNDTVLVAAPLVFDA
jgi:hypothetical protein